MDAYTEVMIPCITVNNSQAKQVNTIHLVRLKYS